jgi:hypothetical protein
MARDYVADLPTIISRIKLLMLWETLWRYEQALHLTACKTPWEYWLMARRHRFKEDAQYAR